MTAVYFFTSTSFRFSPQGRVIFCSGSPFPPVVYNGKTIKPGQGNNAYIFPGVALGVIATLMHHIPDNVFLIAARELASTVTDADLESGSLYPPLSSIREVSLKIAIGVTKYAYCKGELLFLCVCVFVVGWGSISYRLTTVHD